MGLDIHVSEEVFPHKGVVRLVVLLWKPHVLIHVESDHVLEAQLVAIEFCLLPFAYFLGRHESSSVSFRLGLKLLICIF